MAEGVCKLIYFENEEFVLIVAVWRENKSIPRACHFASCAELLGLDTTQVSFDRDRVQANRLCSHHFILH